ncbi:MAG: isochorismate synthase [Cyanobacteria bacterium J06621_11]
MPVVRNTTQIKTDRFNKTDTIRFLSQCQQQAAATHHPKIASLSFKVAPIEPWIVLETLRHPHKRHFYYDPPHQPSVVGIDVLMGASAQGRTRFTQAQDFVQRWRSHFIYADRVYADQSVNSAQSGSAGLLGRFFCSATFFADAATVIGPMTGRATGSMTGRVTSPQPEAFEPVYVFIPQAQVTTQVEFSTVTFNVLVTATTEIERAAERLYRQMRRLEESKSIGTAQAASQKVVSKDVSGFAAAVQSILPPVKQGPLHKVVLADVMDVVAPQVIDEVRSLQTLRQNHPDCTVFALSNGKGQSFIGASPERLLSIDQGQLMTDALAGSAPRSPQDGIDRQLAQSLLHSKKERYEHSVVVDFIVRQLRSLGLNPHYTDAPQILQLAHIQHLHTPISARLNPKVVSPLEILDKLHPTPAVAGLPRQLACELIHQHETFDRGLYAAPLGWLDTEGNSEFIVGIRSALINGCKARLYAGAGIVAGSEPAKELAEIKLKLQTLLNALV